MPAVLVAEEDPQFRAVLGDLLHRHGYLTLAASSAPEAVEIAGDYAPDLVILEWTMAGLSEPGELARLRCGRADGGPRLLILSRRGGEEERVAALAASADDYLTKPCSPGELIARIHALLRRGPAPSGGVLRAGSVELHLLSRRVFRGGERIDLSATQFGLLRHFVQNPRRMLVREQLRDALLRPDTDPRTVDVHVRRMRGALNAGGRPDLFRTVRKGGYVFEPDAAPEAP